MRLKSVITLNVAEEAASNSSGIYRQIVATLDRFHIPFSFHTHCEKLQSFPLEPVRNYYLIFELDKEVRYPESIHYISQIIEGICGLAVVVDRCCYSYSYNLKVD